MKIAFGFDIFYPESNGVITTTINLANNLIDMGHEVYFFVPAEKDFKDDVIENGIHIIHVKSLPSFIYSGIKLLPKSSWYLRKYFRKYNFDIVHSTSPWLVGQALGHAARRTHTPVLYTHHTLIDNPIYIKYALKSRTLAEAARKPIWSVVFAPFFKLVWMVTAPNKETCDTVRGHVDGIDVRYVSNGIDISRFESDVPTATIPQIPDSWINRDSFIFVGRLGYEKAIDVTIHAFAIAAEKNKDIKLIVIGDGPVRNEITKLVNKLECRDRILMTGKIDNHILIGSQILKKVNTFLTASLSENQAITVIEALCSGCPVICPNVFNMTELVDDTAGWHFEAEDVQGMADTILHVHANPEERDEKSRNAAAKKELYDGRRVAKEFEEIYKELLEMKKNGFYVYEGERKARKYEMELKKYYDTRKN